MTTDMIKNSLAEYFKAQPVLKAWLFGSFSREEQTPDSDVDILVLLCMKNIMFMVHKSNVLLPADILALMR